MTIPRKNVVTTDHEGSTGIGTIFDDKPSASNISSARIKKITIWHNNKRIYCLKVDYNNQQGFDRGRIKGSQVEILLDDDEYITVVEGSFYNNSLSGLLLTTSKGCKYGPYAMLYSDYGMVWDASKLALDPTIKGDLGLLYFTGTCDDYYLYSLSATFVNCVKGNHISPIIKYERRAPSSTGASEGLEALSQFARNLMSPIVTLVVGPSKTEFFVYERVISRIPFFAAALDGRFSEAIQKKIVMPGENPESIAALIEFLYTGHYTYPYTCEDMSSNLNVPTADRAEGVFHIGVYVAGDKYDCEELSKAAMVGIVNAMGELKGIDCIRFWSEVYLSGLSIGLLKDFPNIGDQIVQTLKVVYTDHGEEVATIIKDIPELGNDFLKLSLGYCAV